MRRIVSNRFRWCSVKLPIIPCLEFSFYRFISSSSESWQGWAGVGREADRFSFVCRWHFHIMDAGDGDTVLPCYCVQYWAVEHFILLFAAAARCLKCFNWINTHFHVDTATGACGSALWILMWWEGHSVLFVSYWWGVYVHTVGAIFFENQNEGWNHLQCMNLMVLTVEQLH